VHSPSDLLTAFQISSIEKESILFNLFADIRPCTYCCLRVARRCFDFAQELVHLTTQQETVLSCLWIYSFFFASPPLCIFLSDHSSADGLFEQRAWFQLQKVNVEVTLKFSAL